MNVLHDSRNSRIFFSLVNFASSHLYTRHLPVLPRSIGTLTEMRVCSIDTCHILEHILFSEIESPNQNVQKSKVNKSMYCMYSTYILHISIFGRRRADTALCELLNNLHCQYWISFGASTYNMCAFSSFIRGPISHLYQCAYYLPQPYHSRYRCIPTKGTISLRNLFSF